MRNYYALWYLFLTFFLWGCVLELPADKELKNCIKPTEITIDGNAANPLLVNLSLKGTITDVAAIVWRVNNGSNAEVSRSQTLTAATGTYSLTLPQLGSYTVFADVKTTCGESVTLTKSYKTCFKPTEITATNEVTDVLKVQLALNGTLTDVSGVVWRINNSSNTEVARSQELAANNSSISMMLSSAGSYTIFADVKTTCNETLQFSKAFITRNCAKPTAVTATADAGNPLKLQLTLSGLTSDVTKTVWKVTNSSSVEIPVSSSGTGITASVTLPAYGTYTIAVTLTTLCGETIPLSTIYNAVSIYPEMAFVQGATFQMGGENGDGQEKPIHNVTLSSYWISKHEVTVKQYREFCSATGYAFPTDTPAWGWQDDNPIVFVSWEDATAYSVWLAQKTGKKYRLPTEAEWEFAARGGINTNRFTYAGSNNFDEVAWYSLNSGDRTHPIGQKKANELGLYDLGGNVWEWCRDVFGAYSSASQTNPTGPDTGTYRVFRGGSFDGGINYGLVITRFGYVLGHKGRAVGFRCALENN